MLSRNQRPKYFALAHRAWRVHALRGDLDDRDREAEEEWRRQQMLDVCGARSSLDLDPVNDYDAIMLHFAQILSDTKLVEYYATAKERRMRNRIRIAMRQLAEIERRPITWDYVRAIHAHMQLPDFDDCPARLLWKVYQALDTHIRRLRERDHQARTTHAA